MTAHHLINEEELVAQCAYCGHEFEQEEIRSWKSVFHIRKHYKENKCCNCGKECSIKVNFCGSGHDAWVSNILKKRNIEDMVK